MLVSVSSGRLYGQECQVTKYSDHTGPRQYQPLHSLDKPGSDTVVVSPLAASREVRVSVLFRGWLAGRLAGSVADCSMVRRIGGGFVARQPASPGGTNAAWQARRAAVLAGTDGPP